MAETNKSQMLSEAELIEAINANTLVSISLGKGQPQKNVTLSTLATVVAGIIGISKSNVYSTIPYLSSIEMETEGIGVLLIQLATYSSIYHLVTISSSSINIISGHDQLTTDSGDEKIYLSISNGKLSLTNKLTSNNLVVRAFYLRM
mgnify:FL=1